MSNAWPPHCTSPTPTDICVQMRIRLLVRPSHKRPRRGARSRCSVRPSPVSPTQPATPCTSPLLCSLPATFSPCPSARPPAFHPPSLPHRIFPTKTAGAPLSPSAAARSRGLCPIFSISMPPTRRHLARCARRSAAAAAIDVRRAAVSYDFGQAAAAAVNEEAGSILPPPPPPMPRSRQSLLGGRIQVAGGGRRVRRRMSFLISDCSSRPADRRTQPLLCRRSRSPSISSENVASLSNHPSRLQLELNYVPMRLLKQSTEVFYQ